MISARGSPPTRSRATTASAMALTCSANSPGTTRPRRTPRRPSMGLLSWSRSTAASRRTSSGSGSPVARATAIVTIRSARSGRNSWSGGSRSRIVAGSPSMASSRSVKSARCRGSRTSSAASRSSARVGEDHAFDEHPSRTQEHVLGPAQADPLGAHRAGARRVLDRVGVRSHSHAPYPVGGREQPVDRAHQLGGLLVGVVEGRLQPHLEVARDGRRHDRAVPEEHLAGRAVDGHLVAGVQHEVADARLARALVDDERLRPADAGLAHAARDDGGVGRLPARST